MSRLPNRPGQRIDRGTKVSFTFDGKRVDAYEGDTIGSALYAAGQRTFSRSFKYHRRRGLMCCAGQCPNCIVSVDGAPGARACIEPVRDGLKVEHVNAVSLELDPMRATDVVGGPFTPPGFYYKTFIRPRKLWPLYEKVLRNVAGLGKLREEQAEREWRTEYRRRHADVLVVGGGIAGLKAAIAAAQLGADVVLADEGPALGGQQLIEADVAVVEGLVGQARTTGVEILERASALGYFDGLVPVWQQDTLHQVRAQQHVFATGAIEQPLVFAGNDLPGVMLAGGARRLAALYAVSPGARAVIATTSDRGLDATRALRDAGVEVIYTGLHQTAEQIVAAAIQEDVDAVGLSVLSGAHMTLFPRVIELLRQQDAGDIVVFGGGIIPDADIAELTSQGVAKIFTPGASTTDIVTWVNETLAPRRVA